MAPGAIPGPLFLCPKSGHCEGHCTQLKPQKTSKKDPGPKSPESFVYAEKPGFEPGLPSLTLLP